jgi:hypothetical protein
MITKEYLFSEIQSIKAQYENYVNLAHQASGAVQALEAILKKLEDDSNTQ